MTGASRGIGRALVQRLTSTGMTAVAIGRTASGLEQVAHETGAFPIALDVSDPTAVEDAFGRIADQEVEFDVTQGPKGPQAENVRAL